MREAAHRRPGCRLAHRCLGRLYFDQGHYESARREFANVIALAPRNPLAHSNLGGTYFAMGILPAAPAGLEKALVLHPSGETYSNLGTVRYMQRNHAAAVQAMEEATRLGEGDYLLRGNLAETSRLVPEKAGRARGAFEPAIDLAKARFTQTPNPPETLCSVANHYARLGHYQQALEAGYRLEEARTIPQLNDLRHDTRFGQIAERTASGGCDSVAARQAPARLPHRRPARRRTELRRLIGNRIEAGTAGNGAEGGDNG